MSADNQQERLDSYIAGYVDGEGSFHVAVQKVKHVRFGYQLIPEFHVSQNADYSSVLEIINTRLKCGYIKPNHAKSNKDKSGVFVVRNRNDLRNKILPFFEKNRLLSPKSEDFKKFARIVRAMSAKEHLSKDVFINLLDIAFSMNRNGKYRKLRIDEIKKNLESSTTIR